MLPGSISGCPNPNSNTQESSRVLSCSLATTQTVSNSALPAKSGESNTSHHCHSAFPLVQAMVIGTLTVLSPHTQQPNQTKVQPSPASAQNPPRALQPIWKEIPSPLACYKAGQSWLLTTSVTFPWNSLSQSLCPITLVSSLLCTFRTCSCLRVFAPALALA